MDVFYKTIPLSLPNLRNGDIMQVLDPEKWYIASQYAPITNDQMNKCMDTKIYRICRASLPMTS